MIGNSNRRQKNLPRTHSWQNFLRLRVLWISKNLLTRSRSILIERCVGDSPFSHPNSAPSSHPDFVSHLSIQEQSNQKYCVVFHKFPVRLPTRLRHVHKVRRVAPCRAPIGPTTYWAAYQMNIRKRMEIARRSAPAALI